MQLDKRLDRLLFNVKNGFIHRQHTNLNCMQSFLLSNLCKLFVSIDMAIRGLEIMMMQSLVG